jgi:hypothetical protein
LIDKELQILLNFFVKFLLPLLEIKKFILTLY